MPSEDTNSFLEKAFRTLADVKEVNFNNCRGPYGWAAERRGLSTDGNVGYLISLTRRWGPNEDTRKMYHESNYRQYRATGDIGSLKMMTQMHGGDRQSKAKVVTRLSYLEKNKIETIEDRIKRVIQTQMAAEGLLSEEDKKIRRMLNASSLLSHRSEHSIDYGGKEFDLVYNGQRKPSVKLLMSENGFAASAKSIADLPLISMPLEFQSKKFRKLIWELSPNRS